MRKPTHSRHSFLYHADSGLFEEFKQRVGDRQVTRYLDALLRFYIENTDRLELKSDPKKGEWLELDSPAFCKECGELLTWAAEHRAGLCRRHMS